MRTDRPALCARQVFSLPAFLYLRSERGAQASGPVRLAHAGVVAYGVAMALLGTACVLWAG